MPENLKEGTKQRSTRSNPQDAKIDISIAKNSKSKDSKDQAMPTRNTRSGKSPRRPLKKPEDETKGEGKEEVKSKNVSPRKVASPQSTVDKKLSKGKTRSTRNSKPNSDEESEESESEKGTSPKSKNQKKMSSGKSRTTRNSQINSNIDSEEETENVKKSTNGKDKQGKHKEECKKTEVEEEENTKATRGRAVASKKEKENEKVEQEARLRQTTPRKRPSSQDLSLASKKAKVNPANAEDEDKSGRSSRRQSQSVSKEANNSRQTRKSQQEAPEEDVMEIGQDGEEEETKEDDDIFVIDHQQAAKKENGNLDIISDAIEWAGKSRTRGSKQKALDSLAITNIIESDIISSSSDSVETIDSDDEDNSVEEVSSSDEEITFSPRRAKPMAKFNKEEMDNEIDKLKKEYNALLRKKNEEIERLKNAMKWKDDQLEEMTELTVKNMELESKLDHILSDKTVYEEEVKEYKKRKATPRQSKKPHIASKKGEKDDTIEVIDEDSREATITIDSDTETPKKRKTRNDTKEARAKEEDDDDDDDDKKAEPKTRKGRRKRGTKEQVEEENIDTLFVSDEEPDPDEEEEKDKKKKRKTKKEREEEEEEEKKKMEEEKKEEGAEKDKDDSDDDDDDDEKNQHGRKQIRKLMTGKKLAEETKAAAIQEKERLERLKKVKHHRDEHIDPKTKITVCTKLVLEMKADGKTPLVEVNSKLIKKLKPHQVEAVEFLWDCLIETLARFKEKGEESGGSGCILAHCMGLGKTLSSIAFVHTCMMSKLIKFKTCLVVAPLNTVLNWQVEWNKWLDKKDRVKVYELTGAKNNHQRADMLQKWHKEGGVMIMGYQIFRILAMLQTKSKKKKQIFHSCLTDPGPDVVICDEGHMLKNDQSAVSKCMNQISTKRRIVLTGTPLQNNLIEYHCMVNFVKKNLLGTRREFGNRFVNPITNGQHSDSTARDFKLMKRRAHVLHTMLSGCVQRRDYSALSKFLPPKHEYVISVRLSKLQIELYEKYMELNTTRNASGVVMSRGTSLFADYQALMRIWTHPRVLKLDEIRQEKKKKSKMTYNEDDDSSFLTSGSDSDVAIIESTTATSDDEESSVDNKSEGKKSQGKNKDKEVEEAPKSDSDSDIEFIPTRRSSRRHRIAETEDSESKDSSEAKKGNEKKDPQKEAKKEDGQKGEGDDTNERKSKIIAGEVIRQWKSKSRRNGDDSDSDIVFKKQEMWWKGMFDEEEVEKKLELSGKLVLMFEILRMAEGLGDKVLVFSQSILSLDVIEEFLSYRNKEAQETKSKKGKKKKGKSKGPAQNANVSLWEKDEDYVRMDGSTGAQNRKKLTSTFNDAKNKRLRLFLISTRAGGLGINLDTANRVIIFDASWNPSHDIQSIFRVYRFGQEKNVFVYRFLAQGTMEEKIYERQVTKETLSQRVIDENQIDRHFTMSDLQELYIFKPDRLDDPDRKKVTPKMPQDLILTELLSEQKDWILDYHEHDSLLEKRPEEDLDEEERKAAWEDYEREKKGLYVYRAPSTGAMLYSSSAGAYRPPSSTINSYLRPPVPNLMPGGAFGMPMMSGMPPGPSMMPPMDMPKVAWGFQIAQLPRVVQEILKYNPNISPTELQGRLQAFLGMHAKYNVPGFAMENGKTVANNEGLVTVTANSQGGPGTIKIVRVKNKPQNAETLANAIAGARADAPASMGGMIAQPPVMLPMGNPMPSTSAAVPPGAPLPSRLPLPGRLPAYGQ